MKRIANVLSECAAGRGQASAHRTRVHSILIHGILVWCSLVASAPAVGGDDESGSATRAARAEVQQTFEDDVAPLLARHCLDCHNASTKDGGLDLSRQSAAFAGGDSGGPIVAGDSDNSLLWFYVESDEMPKDRAPLSDEEKQVLRRWIDAGASWTLEDPIDPDAYLHDGPAAGNWVRRLTVPEYIETVRSAVGVDIAAEARRILPRDQRADGFTNTAYNLGVDLGHIEAYARLAKIIVSRMDVARFAAEHRDGDCDPADEPCMRKLISRMGRSLLRGPLADEELDAYLRVSSAVAEAGGDFDEAVRYVVQAMLQSPRFIYRIERQPGDGQPREVGPYELASRLSYILWGAPPDDELMRAAEAGELADAQQVRAHAERMLEDPRAVDQSLRFISEWINLDRLNSLRPNPDRFPQWTERLAGDMRQETLAFFEDLAWKQDRPLRDLMNAQFTYATPRLAHHYELARGDSDQSNKRDALAGRVTDGLQALYTFEEGRGETVGDVSGAGEPLDLKIHEPEGTRWHPDGLEIHAQTLIASENPPRRLIRRLKKSGAITIEAWITPADTTQDGPARIVTLSRDIGARNFTLGQAADRFETRLRTTKTSGNGIPSLSSQPNTARPTPVHVVYTRGSSGKAVIYVDGQVSGRRKVDGDFSNWDDAFRFALGNELSKDRLWQGVLHRVALYDRQLSADEVRRNHAAGGDTIEEEIASLAVSAAEDGANRKDLLALYRFDSGRGDVVRDRSNASDSFDLRITDPAAVRWGSDGLSVYDATRILTERPPKKLTRSIKRTDAFAVEAWITPANTQQGGPARILTLSSGTSQRNVTLGQDGDRYDARLRAAETDGNGLPSGASRSGAVVKELTHLVFNKTVSGKAQLYVNGEAHDAWDVGDLSKWDDSFHLALANETSGDRLWRGTYHRIAIHRRALSPEEIRSRSDGLSRYDVADNPARGGLLTQASVLTIGGDEASMVTRGLFVLHDLLYSRVGNPPPCVDTTPVPTEPGMSMRDLAEARLADASCAGCHVKFEPLAFGLEKFDGLGAHHEFDHHGNKLREDGEILFPGRQEPVSYETSAELMDLLAESQRVQMAITRKLTQFALGRPLVADDLPHLEKIHAAAQADGGTYRALMTAIVTSDLVRQTRPEKP